MRSGRECGRAGAAVAEGNGAVEWSAVSLLMQGAQRQKGVQQGGGIDCTQCYLLLKITWLLVCEKPSRTNSLNVALLGSCSSQVGAAIVPDVLSVLAHIKELRN